MSGQGKPEETVGAPTSSNNNKSAPDRDNIYQNVALRQHGRDDQPEEFATGQAHTGTLHTLTAAAN